MLGQPARKGQIIASNSLGLKRNQHPAEDSVGGSRRSGFRLLEMRAVRIIPHHEKTSSPDFEHQAQTGTRVPQAHERARGAEDPESSTEKRPLGTRPRLISATRHARERLRLTTQFLAIHRRGSWARGAQLSLGVVANQLPRNRFGLRVRRAVMPKAADRNRAKRLLREVYRRHRSELTTGHDLLFAGNRGTPLTITDLERDFLSLCKRVGLLSK